MAKHKKLREKIEAWLREAQSVCGLCEWIIILDWTLKRRSTLMHITCNYNNFEARISVNLSECSKHPYWYVRRACFHEVAHIILWELSELATERFVNEQQIEDAVERATERIAGILSNI